jgi:hypothetical protein
MGLGGLVGFLLFLLVIIAVLVTINDFLASGGGLLSPTEA